MMFPLNFWFLVLNKCQGFIFPGKLKGIGIDSIKMLKNLKNYEETPTLSTWIARKQLQRPNWGKIKRMKNNFGTLKSSINFAIIPDEISKKRYNSRKFSKTHKSITNREESQTNKNKLTFREQDSRDIS